MMDIEFPIVEFALNRPKPELAQVKSIKSYVALPSLATLLSDDSFISSETNNFMPTPFTEPSFSSQTPSHVHKPKRSQTTPEQFNYLNYVFNRNPYPDHNIKNVLSRELGMSPRVIQVWFQNRRQSIKSRRVSIHLFPY